MAGKVIDLDPSKRLSKEALDLVKKIVTDFKAEELQSLTIIATPKGGWPNVYAYGLDFHAIGVTQTILLTLGQQLMAEEFHEYDPKDD